MRKVLQISRKFQRFLSVPSSNGQLHGFEAPPEEADPQLKKAWNAWYPLQGIDYGGVPTERTIAPFLAQLLGDNLVPKTVFTLNHRINSSKCRVHEQAPGLACITSTLTTSFMSWHCRSGRQGGFLGLRAFWPQRRGNGHGPQVEFHSSLIAHDPLLFNCAVDFLVVVILTTRY